MKLSFLNLLPLKYDKIKETSALPSERWKTEKVPTVNLSKLCIKFHKFI